MSETGWTYDTTAKTWRSPDRVGPHGHIVGTDVSVPSGQITSAMIVDGTIVSADIAATAWTTYTPALTASTTDPTLGSGSTATGRWIQYGKIVFAAFYIKFGSSGANAGNGLYRVSMPVTARTLMRNSFPVGIAWGFSGSVTLQYAGVELVNAGGGGIPDRVEFRRTDSSGSQVFTDTVPFAWTNNSEIYGSCTYEAA